MRYETAGIPKDMEFDFEMDMKVLRDKWDAKCRAAIRALVNTRLARLKFGELVMGMGTYWIEGKLSYTDQYDDTMSEHIHEIATSPRKMIEYGLDDDEAEALTEMFAILDFWLELTGGEDMNL